MLVSGRDDEFAPIMPALTPADIVCLHRWAEITPNYAQGGLERMIDLDYGYHVAAARRIRTQLDALNDQLATF